MRVVEADCPVRGLGCPRLKGCSALQESLESHIYIEREIRDMWFVYRTTLFYQIEKRVRSAAHHKQQRQVETCQDLLLRCLTNSTTTKSVAVAVEPCLYTESPQRFRQCKCNTCSSLRFPLGAFPITLCRFDPTAVAAHSNS